MSDPLDLPNQLGATLRRLRHEDAPALLAAVDAERSRLEEWLNWPRRVADLAGAERVLNSYRDGADGRVASFGVFGSDRLLGGTNLVHYAPDLDQVELGVWAITAAEGRGLMRAACAATIRYARRELRVARLVWRSGIENHRSRALAGRLGFVEEGVARSSYVLDGRRLDVVVCSLVETELDVF
jgi:ribosomal-protein-serine acetyltransferase